MSKKMDKRSSSKESPTRSELGVRTAKQRTAKHSHQSIDPLGRENGNRVSERFVEKCEFPMGYYRAQEFSVIAFSVQNEKQVYPMMTIEEKSPSKPGSKKLSH